MAYRVETPRRARMPRRIETPHHVEIPRLLAPAPVCRLPVQPNTTFDRPFDSQRYHEDFTQLYDQHRERITLHETIIENVDRSAALGLRTAPREVDGGIAGLQQPLSSTTSLPPTPLSTQSAPATASGSTAGPSVGAGNVENTEPTLREMQDDFAMAQLAHPAAAAVFVGNLPADRPDDVLSLTVKRAFAEFGQVSVYIKRTYCPSNVEKPWALLQYHSISAAHEAIREGNFMMYGQRRLRVEISQARRHITILRADGQVPTVIELWHAFSQYGHVEQIYNSGFPYGVGIRFSCYGSYALAKEAIQSGTTPYLLR